MLYECCSSTLFFLSKETRFFLYLFSYSSSQRRAVTIHCKYYILYLYTFPVYVYLIRMYTDFVIILFSFYFLLHIEVKFIL